jgi:photosystem II stability/assembly factor-like uncharacterized protein
VIEALDLFYYAGALQCAYTLFVIARDSLLRSRDGGARWKNLVHGLDNRGRLRNVAISPAFHNDKEVFVSSDSDGLYKSCDGGDSWDKMNYGLTGLNVGLLAISPDYASDRTVLLADCERGLFVSRDGGERWSRVKHLNSQINAMAFCSGHAGLVLAGDRESNLYLSSDKGDSWKHMRSLGRGSINAIAPSPSCGSDGTFFVGTERTTPFGKAVILKTDDFGLNFTPANLNIGDNGVTSIALSPEYATDATIFATTWREACFRSRDGGATWEKRSHGLTSVTESKLGRPRSDFRVLRVSNNFRSDRTLFLAGFDGLFQSVDGGDRWTSVETISVRYVDGVAISPNFATDRTIAVNTYAAGIVLSDDAGLTWRSSNVGLRSVRGLDIAFSPNYAVDQTVFATCRIGPAAFLKSVNQGKTWSEARLMKGRKAACISALARIALMPKRIRNLLSSRFGFETTVIAVSPAYSEDGTVLAGGIRGQVFKSVDGGSSFVCVRYGTGRGAIKSLIISPSFSADRTIFASAGSFDISRMSTRIMGVTLRTPDTVLKTTDGGRTWQPAGRGLPLQRGTGIRLAISPDYQRDQTAFAASSVGLFRTTNGAQDWSRVGQFSPLGADVYVEAVAVSPLFPADQTVLVTVRGHGLFKSTDRGTTFRAIASELIATNHSLAHMWGYPGFGIPLQFASTYAEEGAILGTSTEELFISTDRGHTWRQLIRPVRYEDAPHNAKVLSFDPHEHWEVRRHPSLSMCTATCSGMAGSRAVLRFVGTGVTLIGSQGCDQGIAQVSLDGNFHGCIDQFDPTRRFQVPLFSVNNLKPGPHILVLTVAGTCNPKSTGFRVEIDAFDVVP